MTLTVKPTSSIVMLKGDNITMMLSQCPRSDNCLLMLVVTWFVFIVGLCHKVSWSLRHKCEVGHLTLHCWHCHTSLSLAICPGHHSGHSAVSCSSCTSPALLLLLRLSRRRMCALLMVKRLLLELFLTKLLFSSGLIQRTQNTYICSCISAKYFLL